MNYRDYHINCRIMKRTHMMWICQNHNSNDSMGSDGFCAKGQSATTVRFATCRWFMWMALGICFTVATWPCFETPKPWAIFWLWASMLMRCRSWDFFWKGPRQGLTVNILKLHGRRTWNSTAFDRFCPCFCTYMTLQYVTCILNWCTSQWACWTDSASCR